MRKEQCHIDSCANQQTVAHGLCRKHYGRWIRYADPYWVGTSGGITKHKICTAPSCSNAHVARGYCCKHYNRLNRYGDINTLPLNRDQPCSIKKCIRPSWGRGYCRTHYARWRAGIDMDPPIGQMPRRRRVIVPADVAARTGFCACGCGKATKIAIVTHVNSHQYRGFPNRYIMGHGSRGGRKNVITTNGYVVTMVRNHPHANISGYVMQHRLVMEQIIGRYLRPFENVHHLNGVRSDNRPENLELWTKPQVPGQRVKDQVKWVIENYLTEIEAALREREQEW